jgi:hydrogenase maturation factor
VILGPRPGEDAAVVQIGEYYLIAKTDPITFATDEIGWYAVNVNANDIAVMGGTPAWFMATLLLPVGTADQPMVETIFEQITAACESLNVSLIGGHTEITYGIDRPILSGVVLGLATKEQLILTGGAQPGDTLIVTKGVPIEATAIIARERKAALVSQFSVEFLDQCAAYLHDPGISVVRDAQIAIQAGRVHAMHDPTEGGLATGLWEMADASEVRLNVSPEVAVLEQGRSLCEAVGLDPLGAIASGALLMSVPQEHAASIMQALREAEIPSYIIGEVQEGPSDVIASGERLHRPPRDEITRLFEQSD